MSVIDHVPDADTHYRAICTQLFGPGSQLRFAPGFPPPPPRDDEVPDDGDGGGPGGPDAGRRRPRRRPTRADPSPSHPRCRPRSAGPRVLVPLVQPRWPSRLGDTGEIPVVRVPREPTRPTRTPGSTRRATGWTEPRGPPSPRPAPWHGIRRPPWMGASRHVPLASVPSVQPSGGTRHGRHADHADRAGAPRGGRTGVPAQEAAHGAGPHRVRRGVIIGAGIFTLTGRAAKEVAGPSIVLSFVLAAICCASRRCATRSSRRRCR